MELLIEFLAELIFEGTIELSMAKNVPKLIRYILIVIIMCFFLTMFFGLGLFGTIAIIKREVAMGVFLLLVDAILIGSFIYRFIKIVRANRKVETKNEKSAS